MAPPPVVRPSRRGGTRRSHAGPADDAEITRRAEDFRAVEDHARARLRIVSALVLEAIPPRQDRMVGDIARALAEAGPSRLPAMLVGTAGFGAHPGLVGAPLPAVRP